MSVKIMQEVWDHSAMSGTALLVLLKLADNANEETRVAWPSVALLAAKCRVSRRTVQRALREIEDAGEIVLVRAAAMSEPARYRVLGGGVKLTPPTDGGGASPVTGGGVTRDGGGASPVTPEPEEEPLEPEGSAREGELISDPIPAALRTWFVAEVAERRGGVAPRATADWDRAARILATKPRGEFKSVVSWGLDRQFWFKKIKTLPSLALHYPDLRAEWAAAQKQRQARNGEDPERAARIAASYEQKYT